jgi:hypothetical protein
VILGHAGRLRKNPAQRRLSRSAWAHFGSRRIDMIGRHAGMGRHEARRSRTLRRQRNRSRIYLCRRNSRGRPSAAIGCCRARRSRRRCAKGFPRPCATLRPTCHAQVPDACWRDGWWVHWQPAGSGDNVVKYLACYVRRTAMSDERIIAATDQAVRFRYTDSAAHQRKERTLTAEEFMRRYLQHVPPPGQHRVRYFGWMHPAAKKWLWRFVSYFFGSHISGSKTVIVWIFQWPSIFAKMAVPYCLIVRIEKPSNLCLLMKFGSRSFRS